MAHDGLMGGHLGIQRTKQKVISNFYWPGVNGDVTSYCRSCDICQKTVDKGRQGKAPLGEMPIIRTPFQRVAVDIVGPIVPCSDRGHKYILTVVDFASRYPEAVALKKIDVISVAEALIEIFCRVGFPSEILSDRGSQFMSSVMGEVTRLLSMKQIFTTPYHPMCNGLVERFNGTLKKILKKMCAETPKDWDRYLHAVLFAYRTSIQESTGFTPFELVTGRKIQGPMDLLRKYWSREEVNDEVRTVYRYVMELKQRLEDTCRLACGELKKAQLAQKNLYDKRAREKMIKPGDKVLLLLPMKSNKLLMQWRGPFEVVEKKSQVNYVVKVKTKCKNFHVNMLKPYVERKKLGTPGVVCAMIVKDGERANDPELLQVCPIGINDEKCEVDVNPGLDDVRRESLKTLLVEYKDVLSSQPGRTNAEVHSIRLTSDEPVRVRPYPIPYALRDTISKEVQDMLAMGIIRESSSPYASPPVLVKKPDGSNRFCVNYKALNACTVFDGEPMPDPEDVFIKLRGKRYKSKMDLSKGYWQIELSSESIEKTAFVTHEGVFEFLRLPFGLKNAASSCNRLMRKVLDGLDCVGRFVDDVIIFSDSWQDHLRDIRLVLERLKNAGLTVKPSKCKFGYEEIEFVGHKVTVEGLSPREQKVREILDVPRPTTKRQVKSFLSLAGYYSRFIPLYSDVSEPLTQLIKKGQPNRVKWSLPQQSAFDKLKAALSELPILKIFDASKSIFVQTDASEVGIGVSLLQEYDGILHPVRYHSRKLKPAEKNYSTIEKECLAIVWAIERLKVFLYGREFVLLVDNKPLSFLKSSNMKNARVARWALFLQDWSFTVKSIYGSENHVADFLSRV